MSRRVLITMAVLAALILGAMLLIATLQLWSVRGLVGDQLSAATGRSISIRGEARLRPGLLPKLHVEDVVVGPVEGSSLRSARIGRLAIVLRLWPLLFGDLVVHQFELEDAEVSFEPTPDDEVADEELVATRRSLLLRGMDVRNLTIRFRSVDGGTTTAAFDKLTLRTRDDERRVDVHAEGHVAGVGFDLSGRFERDAAQSAVEGRGSIAVEGHVAGAKLSGEGWLEDASSAPKGELRLRAEARHLNVFSDHVARELPELGPVQASALLALADGVAGFSELDLKIGSRDTAWLEVTGDVRDIAKQQGFSLDADFGVSDLDALAPLVGNPPPIGTLVGKLVVHDLEGKPGIEHFSLKGGRKGIFEIDAEGHFRDILGVHDLDAHVDLEARDLAVLGELFGKTLPPIGPVQFSGEVDARTGQLKAEGIRARLDRTHFQGSIYGTFEPGQRPRITARLEIPELYLGDVGIEPRPSDRGDASAGAAASDERLFSDEPLPLGWSEVVDADLSIHADQVAGEGGPLLDDLKLDAKLKDRKLSLRHLVVGFDGGSIESVLRVDADTAPPTFALNATAKGVQLGRLVEQIDADRAYSGRIDARLDLKAQGASPRALVSALQGEVVLSCGAGTIATAQAGLMTRDLFGALRRVAGRNGPTATLNCLIADFELEKGVATARTLVLDSENLVVFGDGQIDLGAETIDLRLVPTPRSASPLSTAATVRVTGPLMAPDVRTVPRSLATSTTRAIVGSITSVTGARLAWRKLRGGVSDQSLCAKLVGSAP